MARITATGGLPHILAILVLVGSADLEIILLNLVGPVWRRSNTFDGDHILPSFDDTFHAVGFQIACDWRRWQTERSE